jgi:hypothetical protein
LEAELQELTLDRSQSETPVYLGYDNYSSPMQKRPTDVPRDTFHINPRKRAFDVNRISYSKLKKSGRK